MSIVIDTSLERYEADVRRELGPDAATRDEQTLARYGAHGLPGPDIPPVLVTYPGSTGDVQTLVRLAARHKIELCPLSTGQNIGMGSAAAARHGQVIVDLGRRMNRILHVDDVLNYVVVEPGVTYQQLHDELLQRGDRLMLDTTSGPPLGGPLGNTLDKGAGYTPAGDHFGNSCGFEVVLPDGRVLRTGDGSVSGAKSWHLSKYGLGPVLDGLFVQSNLGIVTKMGIWLLQRPPVVRAFGFSYPEDEDLAEIIELVRPLKLSNAVPTAIKVTSDLYSLGTEMRFPEDLAGGASSLDNAARAELRRRHNWGAWTVTGAVYAADEGAAEAQLTRVREHFLAGGKATYLDHETISSDPKLRIHLDTYTGRPTASELGIRNWRGGGLASMTPGTPLIGSVAAEHQALSRRILDEHGFDFVVEYICAGRLARALHMVLFDSANPEERSRAVACVTALADAYAAEGWPVSRMPIHLHGDEMQRREVFKDVCSAIKSTIDPDHLIAPSRYGIV
ncbi:FAD-binding protein [Nocardia sp. R6R-6]|uniref:FAD-binding protein n=1 Tax=Nocardia sp. R6R-6 TaxID=3459303 RepID=UPI00403DD4A2